MASESFHAQTPNPKAPIHHKMKSSAVSLLLFSVTSSSSSATRVFPQRTSAEAAIVEWGHSAIISALDGAVASFGPQTSMGASFEVETAPVLANPIDGVGNRLKLDDNNMDVSSKMMQLPRLDNSDAALGNMVIMTDSAGLSGVAMARIAKISGAAALMIVNTDERAGDYIYSLEPETDEEAKYATDHIDIPVFMVSLQAGNVITTALATDDMDADVVNAGGALPDRVRLYAGGDRPFFEDAVSQHPLVYLIHNLLTNEECNDLIHMADGKYDRVVDDAYTPGLGVNNFLENMMQPSPAKNVDRVVLWKGDMGGKFFKDIDERISQVTGFPIEHLSDFEINKHTSEKSYYVPHYDINESNSIMASITIFLSDIPRDNGGEIVYPETQQQQPDGKTSNEAVVIHPVKGLAIIHHNTDDKYNFDKSTVHKEAVFKGRGEYKYVAKKYIYLNPQPRNTRVVLPLLASPFGGKLPRVIITMHNILLDKFGMDKGELYFRKIITVTPILLLIVIVSLISNLVIKQMKSMIFGSSGGSDDGKTKKGREASTSVVEGRKTIKKSTRMKSKKS